MTWSPWIVNCGSVLLGPAGDGNGCTTIADSGRAKVNEKTPTKASRKAQANRLFIGTFILPSPFRQLSQMSLAQEMTATSSTEFPIRI
jgi:hypothetical protein